MYRLEIIDTLTDEIIMVESPIIPNNGDMVSYESKEAEGMMEGLVFSRDFIFNKENKLDRVAICLGDDKEPE